MSKQDEEATSIALTTVCESDGWSDAAAEGTERVFKGMLLKFADWKWSSGKEGNPVAEGTRLIALSTTAAWVKWKDGKPVEYRMRQAGRRLPDRKELGDLNEDDWDAAPDGGPRDPWRNTRFMYLVDPVSAEAFTFSISSWGGREAVIDLADQIERMRLANPGAVPVVELRAAPMQTKFGKKSKPWLKVVDWRGGGALRQTETKGENNTTAKPARIAMFDDDIPF